MVLALLRISAFATSCKSKRSLYGTVQRMSSASYASIGRFYVEEAQLRDSVHVELSPEEAHHISRVLRGRVGDRLELADGNGCIAEAYVSNVGKNGVAVVRSGVVRHSSWVGPQLELAVACGTLKGGRIDWLVEKATELGAFAFRPLLPTRAPHLGSERTSGTHLSGRLARMDRVALAALKQSQRTHAMVLKAPCAMNELVDLIPHMDAVFIADAAGRTALRAMDRVALGRASSVLLIVGPEGGFTSSEVTRCVHAGAVPVSLGELRLRSETAALALLTVARFACLGA